MLTESTEYLQAELHRLDLLLHREILRLRATYQLSLDEFRGLYISDEQVDSLIRQVASDNTATPDVETLTRQAEALRRENADRLIGRRPWTHLINEFGLLPLEADVLLLALAPELDPKYETLYAYLNNDIHRKWPTCDLALRLLCADPTRKAQLRARLMPGAPLFANGLLELAPATPERPTWLSRSFALATPVTHFLLGLPPEQSQGANLVEWRYPEADWNDVPLTDELRVKLRRVPRLFQDRPGLILILEGRHGAGQDLAAQAVCRDLGIPLLQVDLPIIRAAGIPLDKLGRELTLQARLTGAGVYLNGGEALLERDGAWLPDSQMLLAPLASLASPVFLVCPPDMPWYGLLPGKRHLTLSFLDPDYTQRRRLWASHVTQKGYAASEVILEALANRFVLTSGQIRHAVQAAVDRHSLGDDADTFLGDETLLEAARAQSNHSLGRLAVKVSTTHTWQDLVLPPTTLQQVKQVAAAIKNHHVVYSQWGFGQRIVSGRGLKVLFAGASGTGKTMAAGVIARELGLDLFKIDLAGVVSKYIGETEKNLDRIFRAAQASNAILFFDEADALFGKRSEVKDAHDRYANIEVAYLLQKMEEHEGAVILASNLSRNIDEAFSRRMHYVVEFPFPDETHRERLWRGIFPSQAPLGQDADLRFLARQFPLAGGDIRNVALDAAFLAAQDGRVITMRHLARAMARQTLKQGKVPSATDFKQHYALLALEE